MIRTSQVSFLIQHHQANDLRRRERSDHRTKVEDWGDGIRKIADIE